MATFRSGFKIFGELTLRQSLGRIRSYSEDRKPGSWLPEDQWAVRPPCTTCPDPCVKKKPAKTSKSWLSICRDPEPVLPCDIRHNNCPPPKKVEVEPWYAFITKKKPEKPKPPLEACRAELQRQAQIPDEEDTCENMGEIRWTENPPKPTEEFTCKERKPAPVIRLSCPPPKELDLMLWCGKPCLSVTRIASQCQSDRMPYEEFKPRKCWKPPPYSLPSKCETPTQQPFSCNVGRAPLAEFKQVEIPKPVYTRYKSVELEDENFLLCMTDAKCPPEDCGPSLALEPSPPKKPQPSPKEPKQEPCSEKPVLVAGSRKPTKLRCAPKFKFRPKPTKLIEKRHFRNPCAQHKACDLRNITPPSEEKPNEINLTPQSFENPPKVITSNICDEPQTFQRNTPSKKPPMWMLILSKPGSKDTPLVPPSSKYPEEPDWSGETDGLKFYDGEDRGITPKPPPDPYSVNNESSSNAPNTSTISTPVIADQTTESENYILMPDNYNIRNMRPAEDKDEKDLSEATFQQFIDIKTAGTQKCSKSYPPIKESILYDFVRNCPLPPVDPSKPDPPPRRRPEPECPQPNRFFYRKYSTFTHYQKSNYTKPFIRMYSEDSSEQCKPRKLVPKPKKCKTVKKPTCNEITLPFCPKARIPPSCSEKKVMPVCKKKLAPKPSYSECVKDPLPRPKNTECNVWERKSIENKKKDAISKGRRCFSTWATEKGNIRSKQNEKNDFVERSLSTRPNLTALGFSPSEHFGINEKGKSLNKNKRTSHIIRNIFTGKQLMLNFMNPAEDSDSYYKSEKLIKRRKSRPWKKLKSIQPDEKNMERSFGIQQYEKKVISLLLQDHHTRNDTRAQNLKISNSKSGLRLYLDNNSSTNLIGSISNWIKKFFKVQEKGSYSNSLSSIKSDQPLVNMYVEAVDVDRIMKLTKPFRHGRKSTEDKVKYFAVDPLGVSQLQSKLPFPLKRLWDRKWNKSLALFPDKERALSSMWKLEALSPIINVKPEKKVSIDLRESNEVKLLQTSTEKGNQKFSRLYMEKSKEYSLPMVENFGDRTFLVKKNPSENHNLTRWHIPEKNDFRYYSTYAMNTDGRAVIFPKQIRMNSMTKDITIKSRDETLKFMQSATNTLVEKVFRKKKSHLESSPYSKKLNYVKVIESITFPGKTLSWFYINGDLKNCLKNNISKINFMKNKSKKWHKNIAYSQEWEKSNGKNADKYSKRWKKNIFPKLDAKKSALKLPEREKEYNNCKKKRSDQSENFQKTGKQTKLTATDNDSAETVTGLTDSREQFNAARILNRSLSTGDLSRGLNNNFDLYDDNLDFIQFENRKSEIQRQRNKMNNPNVQELLKRKNISKRSSSMEKMLFSSNKKRRENCRSPRSETNSSNSSKNNAKRNSEISQTNSDESDKTSKRDMRDSVIRDKNQKNKPGCGSKENLSNTKKKDEFDEICRSNISKKPGPNCPKD